MSQGLWLSVSLTASCTSSPALPPHTELMGVEGGSQAKALTEKTSSGTPSSPGSPACSCCVRLLSLPAPGVLSHSSGYCALAATQPQGCCSHTSLDAVQGREVLMPHPSPSPPQAPLHLTPLPQPPPFPDLSSLLCGGTCEAEGRPPVPPLT